MYLIVDFQYLQSRDEKKSGLVTCYVLVSVNKKDIEEMRKEGKLMKTDSNYEKFKRTYESVIDLMKR